MMDPKLKFIGVLLDCKWSSHPTPPHPVKHILTVFFFLRKNFITQRGLVNMDCLYKLYCNVCSSILALRGQHKTMTNSVCLKESSKNSVQSKEWRSHHPTVHSLITFYESIDFKMIQWCHYHRGIWGSLWLQCYFRTDLFKRQTLDGTKNRKRSALLTATFTLWSVLALVLGCFSTDVTRLLLMSWVGLQMVY